MKVIDEIISHIGPKCIYENGNPCVSQRSLIKNLGTLQDSLSIPSPYTLKKSERNITSKWYKSKWQ